MARGTGKLVIDKTAIIADYTSDWIDPPYIGQGEQSQFSLQFFWTGATGTKDAVITLEFTNDSSITNMVTVMASATTTIGAETSAADCVLTFPDIALNFQAYRIKVAINSATAIGVFKVVQYPTGS